MGEIAHCCQCGKPIFPESKQRLVMCSDCAMSVRAAHGLTEAEHQERLKRRREEDLNRQVGELQKCSECRRPSETFRMIATGAVCEHCYAHYYEKAFNREREHWGALVKLLVPHDKLEKLPHVEEVQAMALEAIEGLNKLLEERERQIAGLVAKQAGYADPIDRQVDEHRWLHGTNDHLKLSRWVTRVVEAAARLADESRDGNEIRRRMLGDTGKPRPAEGPVTVDLSGDYD